jgi:hypothetical protein
MTVFYVLSRMDTIFMQILFTSKVSMDSLQNLQFLRILHTGLCL